MYYQQYVIRAYTKVGWILIKYAQESIQNPMSHKIATAHMNIGHKVSARNENLS